LEEKTTQNKAINPASFRDPCGFVFNLDGVIYRQVNECYKQHYDLLIQSGLYKALIAEGLLIEHEELSSSASLSDVAYKVLKPSNIPFISYPYEWSFSQLKDAARTTLKIQRMALDHGMSLKDASAYNIQFINGRPIFIDTLSFETYREGAPWVAYRQFCQHFLAPLALMACKDIRLGQLLRIYIDGIPIDLADILLPAMSILRPHLFMHIHLHAKSQRQFAKRSIAGNFKMKRSSLLGLIDSLESAINGLKWKPKESEWMSYYEADINYSPAGFEHKKQLVASFLKQCAPKTVWDMGANIGEFSHIASREEALTVSWDVDPACVELNYRTCRETGEENILPLLLDLTNPSPAVGWAHEERKSLMERGPVNTVMALALIHHLAIANNVPFKSIAEFFSKLCRNLIIEFVPKNDSQVQRLLKTREDIFSNYSREDFEKEFMSYFRIIHCIIIKDSDRVLYLMEKDTTQ
jgi:hypothetical protein